MDSSVLRTSISGVWGGKSRICCILRTPTRLRSPQRRRLPSLSNRFLHVKPRTGFSCNQAYRHEGGQSGREGWNPRSLITILEDLKVFDLKLILRTAGCKTSGRKTDLVQRVIELCGEDRRLRNAVETAGSLEESLMKWVEYNMRRKEKEKVEEEEEVKLSDISDELVGFQEMGRDEDEVNRGSADDEPFQPMTSMQLDILVGIAMRLNLDDLKTILRSIQAPTSGAKSRVVARVISAAETDKRIQQRLLNLAGMNPYSLVLQAANAKSDVSAESLPGQATSGTSVSQLTMAEIKQRLSEIGLPLSGTKADLVMRLLVAQRSSDGPEGKTPQEQEMYNALMEVEGMSKSKLLDFMADRGLYVVSNTPHMILLDKCKRWILAHYYGIGVRVKRADFEGLLNRQIETQNFSHHHRPELAIRANGLGVSDAGTREELIERLKEARQNCFPISDAANIRIDALAQEWFLQTFQKCREGTFHEKISQFKMPELLAELKRRGLRVDGEEEELRGLLLSVVSIEQGLSQKALGGVATTLIDRVYRLDPGQVFGVMDVEVTQKAGYLKECRDVLLLSLVPRLLQIFDREMAIEKHIKQEVNEIKHNKSWEPEGVVHGSSEDPVSIAVLFEQDPEGTSMATVLGLLDHLQTRKYHHGESPVNLAPNREEDAKQNGIHVVPYLLSKDQRVHRLTAADVFGMDPPSAKRQPVPEGAVLVGDLKDWAKEIHEVDAVLPLLSCPLGSMDSVLESVAAMDDESGTGPSSAQLLKSCIGTYGSDVGGLGDRHWVSEILRSKDFPTLPMFTMSVSDIDEQEAWFKAFNSWCAFNGYDFSTEKFLIRPAEGHVLLEGAKSKPVAECVQEAKQMLIEEEADKVIFQKPAQAMKGMKFNCWVLETKNGPIALLPTEVVYPPVETIRPLSSHIRHYTPPNMDFAMIQSIRKVAEAAFRELDLRDFACIHGVVMMDNGLAYQEKRVQSFPQPIPSVGYDEYLEPEDTTPEHEASVNELWEEHMQEIDELIQDIQTAKEDPRAKEYREYQQGVVGISLDDLQGLTSEYEDYRDRRIPDFEEDMSEVDEFLKSVREDQALSIEEVCKGTDFAIAVTDVEVNLGLQSSNMLFQQAACVGLSQGAVLRHFVNLALARVGHPQIPPVQEMVSSPVVPDLYVEEGEVEDRKDEDEPEEEHIESDTKEYYGRQYGLDDLDPERGDLLGVMPSRVEEEQPGIDEESEEESNEGDGTQQIWILSGGDGPAQQISYQSGLNAWQKLRRSGDLQVYHAVLVPDEYDAGNRERLSALIERRTAFLEQGVPEEAIDTYKDLTLDYMRNPNRGTSSLPWRQVAILDPVAALAPSLDEALENAERRIQAANTAPHERDSHMVGLMESEALCRLELLDAEVNGVCGLWGEEDGPCPSSKMTTLEIFTGEAALAEAILYLAIHGGMGEDGTLQEDMEQKDLLYTGSGVVATQLCSDKSAARKHMDLQLDESSDLFAIDGKEVSFDDLVGLCDSPEGCRHIFDEACTKLEVSELMIKPNRGAQGGCVARLKCPHDLQVFGQAIKRGLPRIEDDALSDSHSPVITMLAGSSNFSLEPYIHTGPYIWREDGLVLEGESDWIHLTVGLIGGLGGMRALTPSLVKQPVEARYNIEGKFLYGKNEYATPVPSTICDQRTLDACKRHVQKVGDILGLSGAAQVDLFLNRKTGEVGVIDVDTSPYVGPQSPLLQQSALEPIPLYPDDFYREVVIIAATPFSMESSFDEDLVGYFEDSSLLVPGALLPVEQVSDIDVR